MYTGTGRPLESPEETLLATLAVSGQLSNNNMFCIFDVAFIILLPYNLDTEESHSLSQHTADARL